MEEFVGRKRQVSAKYLGYLHTTHHYEQWVILLRSHANELWGDQPEKCQLRATAKEVNGLIAMSVLNSQALVVSNWAPK